ELLGRRVRKRAATVLRRKVRDDPVRGDAESLELGDRAVAPRLPARRQRDVAAFLRERRRDCEADPLARAGDRRVLALQPEIHAPTSFTTEMGAWHAFSRNRKKGARHHFRVSLSERELELLDEPVELLLLHDQRRREADHLLVRVLAEHAALEQ